MKTKFTMEQCAMAVVFYENKILATRELIFEKNVLSLPKGHVEKGETQLQTAIRECFEETNVQLSERDLTVSLTPYSYNFTRSNTLIRKTVYPFLFRVTNLGSPLAKEKRILSVVWMDVDQFLKDCSYEVVKKTVLEAFNYQ